MKKLKMKKFSIMISVILLLIVVYLFYSRPMSIQQRYPMLNLDKCTELRGYYKTYGHTEATEFAIGKDSEEFDILCSLLYEQDYRRSLRDLLPRGTRVHPTEPGDFQWEVYFHFEDVEFPDGTIGSGGILHIQYWYGELDIYFDDDRLTCYTNKPEAWSKEVLDVIR